MHAIALSFDAAALLCVAAAFGAAIVLYGTWRTRVLQLYLLFVGSISAFAVALSLETAVDIFSIYDISPETVRVVAGAGFVLQAIGGVVHVAVLPHFTYAINNRHPSEAVQRVFFAVSTAMGVLAVVFILALGAALFPLAHPHRLPGYARPRYACRGATVRRSRADVGRASPSARKRSQPPSSR